MDAAAARADDFSYFKALVSGIRRLNPQTLLLLRIIYLLHKMTASAILQLFEIHRACLKKFTILKGYGEFACFRKAFYFSQQICHGSRRTRHPTLKHEVPSNAALHKKLCIFGPNENNTYLGVKLFKIRPLQISE